MSSLKMGSTRFPLSQEKSTALLNPRFFYLWCQQHAIAFVLLIRMAKKNWMRAKWIWLLLQYQHVSVENRSLHKALCKNIGIAIISFCWKKKKRGFKLNFFLALTQFLCFTILCSSWYGGFIPVWFSVGIPIVLVKCCTLGKFQKSASRHSVGGIETILVSSW